MPAVEQWYGWGRNSPKAATAIWCATRPGVKRDSWASPGPGGFWIHEWLCWSGGTIKIETGPALKGGPPPGSSRKGTGRAIVERSSGRNRLCRCCWLYSLGIDCDGTGAHRTSTAPTAGTGFGRPWAMGPARIFWETATAVNTLNDFGGPLQRSTASDGRLGNSENLGPHRGLQPYLLTLPPSRRRRFFGENRIFP